MTVFWSDPTKIHLTLPVVDELEDEYYLPPAVADKGTPHAFTVLGIDGPGVAEIKAHNWEGVKGAIEQLKGRDRLTPPVGRKPSNWTSVQATTNLKKVIITYRPTNWDARNPGNTPKPLTLDVYAVAFDPLHEAVTHYHDERRSMTAKAKWVQVATGLKIPQTVSVSPRNAAIFGAVVETPVRKAFAAQLRANYTKGEPYNLTKVASATGADVVWSEIAELYAELARTTNDEFLAELANELATLG